MQTKLPLAACIAALTLPHLAIAKTKEDTIPMGDLKKYSEVQQKLYPDKPNIYEKARKVFRGRDTITMDEFRVLEKPKDTKPYNYDKNKPKGRTAEKQPADTFDSATARKVLGVYEDGHPKSKGLWDSLLTKYDNQPWYVAKELRDVEENGKDPKTHEENRKKTDPLWPIVQTIREAKKEGGWKGPLIRESWRDVVHSPDSNKDDEDKSDGLKQKVTRDDLVGATFSYVHDGRAHEDTWSAKGALIFPWEKKYPLGGNFSVDRLAFAPSVSVNRLQTNGDQSQNVDSMLFRFGAYVNLHLFDTSDALDGTHYNMELRAAGVYATDTSFGARLPGFEIDLEPRIHNKYFPLGYRKVWFRKAALNDDGKDISIFDTQLRAWLHMEGGTVQDTDGSWDQTKGSFFRIGPVAQIQMHYARGLLGQPVSLTARGGYLGSVSGSHARPYYYSVTLSQDLLKHSEKNRKIAINISYENGGLSFTKEPVDKLTIGLGVLF